MKLFRIISCLAISVVTLIFAIPVQALHPVNVGNSMQVTTGKTVFEENCVACHGKDLKGPENPQDFTGIKPPRLDGAGHSAHHADHAMFEQVANGSRDKNGKPVDNGMPPFKEVLTPAQIWAALTYIKSRWPMTVRMKQSAMSPGHGPGGHGNPGHGHR